MLYPVYQATIKYDYYQNHDPNFQILIYPNLSSSLNLKVVLLKVRIIYHHLCVGWIYQTKPKVVVFCVSDVKTLTLVSVNKLLHPVCTQF